VPALIAEAWAWNSVETIGMCGAWPSGIVYTDWWCIDNMQGRRTRHGRVRRTLAEGMMWSNVVNSEAVVAECMHTLQHTEGLVYGRFCTAKYSR